MGIRTITEPYQCFAITGLGVASELLAVDFGRELCLAESMSLSGAACR